MTRFRNWLLGPDMLIDPLLTANRAHALVDALQALLPVDIRGRWTERQVRAVRDACFWECERLGIRLHIIDVTTHSDTVNWYALTTRRR